MQAMWRPDLQGMEENVIDPTGARVDPSRSKGKSGHPSVRYVFLL